MPSLSINAASAARLRTENNGSVSSCSAPVYVSTIFLIRSSS
jgi:hypothetical protein